MSPHSDLTDLARALKDEARGLLAPSLSGVSSESASALAKFFESKGFDRKAIGDSIKRNLDDVGDLIESDNSVIEPVGFWRDLASDCRSRILEGNIRLVVSLASRHARGFDHRTAVLEGLVGFNRALDTYEPDLGFQMSTYATWWIRQRITRAAMNHRNPIRLPVHLAEEITRLHRATTARWRSGRPVADAVRAAAHELNLDEERVWRLAIYAEPSWPTSWMTSGTGTSIEESLVDLTADPNAVLTSPSTYKDALRLVSAILSTELGRETRTASQAENKERDFDLLKRRLGVGLPRRHTLEQVGRDYDVTRERIRQVESKSLARVRRTNARILSHFLRGLLGPERE